MGSGHRYVQQNTTVVQRTIVQFEFSLDKYNTRIQSILYNCTIVKKIVNKIGEKTLKLFKNHEEVILKHNS